MNIKTPVTQQDIYAYERGWANEMVNIWKEKILHYRIRHTGALFQSIRINSLSNGNHIFHRFLMYGIYQNNGVGNGYFHGNSGKDDNQGLQFLRRSDPRHANKHRQPRPWFSRRYYASVLKLRDIEALLYGYQYQGICADIIRQTFSGKTKL